MLALDRLGRHPFAVKAYFKESLVLSYALPVETLRPLVPACLEIDCYQERSGFLALALVRTQNLRPHFFPAFMGNDFTLLGYRIFVRYRGNDGRRRRGLYILRSETDRTRMVLLGNLFTRYRYRKVGISWQDDLITSTAGLHIQRAQSVGDVALPNSSVFPDWRTARRFAGPMPFTFSYDDRTNFMTSVEGVRATWKPEPVKIVEARVPLLAELGLEEAQLANAFTVKNIPYQWKKGITEPCP
ncbi:MAG: hypothetical protein ACJAVK_002392 [Akkermansiaceae bacterium]|jgi:uncharacterized protein YqjF (DUF2071 family)